MPQFGPISRRELIRGLRACGFEGPYTGAKHSFVTKENLRVRIPNPHPGDIGVGLRQRILQQANISRDEWESVWLTSRLVATFWAPRHVHRSLGCNVRKYSPKALTIYPAHPSDPPAIARVYVDAWRMA